MFVSYPANRYQVEHAERLRRTYHVLTGRDLIEPALSPEAAEDTLFHVPFVVLSHDAAPDPILTYGNLKALELFELTWEGYSCRWAICSGSSAGAWRNRTASARRPNASG